MCKVLIADDEMNIRIGIKVLLESWGKCEFEWIRTTDDGTSAWAEAEKEKPDVLITDINMPIMTGIQLLSKIREAQIDTKVIVLSGYNDFEYVRTMAVLGIENYLLKPVNEEELYATMENILVKLEKEKVLQMKAKMDESLIRENIINRWLYGNIGESELRERADFLGLELDSMSFRPCSIRILGKDVTPKEKQKLYEICNKKAENTKSCHVVQNHNGDTDLIFCIETGKENGQETAAWINSCIDEIQEEMKRKPYVILGNSVEYYWEVADSFRKAVADGVHLRKIELDVKEKDKNETEVSPLSVHMMQYILQNYHQEISLKTTAQHFAGNAAYIGQVFKRDTGKTFSEYLKDIRMEKAKELLLHSDMSMKDIALKVGFQTSAYFSTVFKNEMGISPAEYRKNLIIETM